MIYYLQISRYVNLGSSNGYECMLESVIFQIHSDTFY